MTTPDRRKFMQLVGGGALAGSLPASIARALEIPANNATGTLKDIEHIVILMQENRSFDHYFGTLNGVRGYGDPRPVTLPNRYPVWYQPNSTGPNGTGYVLPFHPAGANIGLKFIQDLAHDWTTTHAAWNNGNYDQWVPNKTVVTMAYLTRADIPFHYALADAFTICDAYHCSVLSQTDPNRLYLFTGWAGNDGVGGGPAVDNSGEGFSWGTFPEKLQAAGITWKVYQDVGLGVTAAQYFGWDIFNPLAGNFGDNPLLLFTQYQTAAAGSPLAVNAQSGTAINTSGTLFDSLIADVTANTLPQVSWIIAPEALSEHPNWPANYGAWYIAQVLDALTANPKVWSKTALLICYDENDGFFDHVVPPTPPMNRAQGRTTADASLEMFAGKAGFPPGPFGLGVRVPMLVVSPWSRGGYVNSQVFDHTSVIRFIERRFGNNTGALAETNITPWRRCVAGDLTSAFNFKTPNAAVVKLPSTAAYLPPDNQRQANFTPTPPAVQSLPVVEIGQRPARALPYRFNVNGLARFQAGLVHIVFENTGSVGAAFQVRSGNAGQGPWTYTVGGKKHLSDDWPVIANGQTNYDLSVYGPNGFMRQFKGGIVGGVSTNIGVTSAYDIAGRSITTTIINNDQKNVVVTASNRYTGEAYAQSLAPGASLTTAWALSATTGWYDILVSVDTDNDFAWRLAGHVENGKDSLTDPGIGTMR